MLTIAYHDVDNAIDPLIMLAALNLGIYISRHGTREYRLSANSGLYAGLVAFSIYVVSSFSSSQTLQLRVLQLPGFNFLPVALGIVLGFAVLQIVRISKLTSGLVGFFILFLVASGSIALFSYFFASPLRNFTVYFALSTLFGGLISVMLFPGVILYIMGNRS